jgi:hypothetical protein
MASLFDILPQDLFKPLASPTRRFYADLLLTLNEKTFSLAADAPRRNDVISEIASFLRGYELANGPLKEEGEALTSDEDRARAIYLRLIETGWFIETKDRYIRLVDIDPDATGLLHVLGTIQRGETRSYGGAVVGVLSALENAAANPQDRSENIRNALRMAQDFLAHMRLVSVSLRKLEDYILRKEALHDIFKAFFEDFVHRHLITDFKTLHTKTNPFRFRSAIIRQSQQMSASSLLVHALGEAYVREGRASRQAEGETAVQTDLATIVTIFENTENHLTAIDNTVAQIERRILNTARYMDRTGRSSEAKIIAAMKAVASVAGGNREVPVQLAMVPHILPMGPPHVPAPRRERLPVQVSEVKVAKPDEAFNAFMAAKSEYTRLTRVTPKGFFDFIDKLLATRDTVRGRDIPIHNVQDFAHFQRLREINGIFDGQAARRYEIVHLPVRLKNEWIECQDFEITRRATAKKGLERNAA